MNTNVTPTNLKTFMNKELIYLMQASKETDRAFDRRDIREFP